MKLGDSGEIKVIDRGSEVFSAALDDGLIARNPLQAKSVSRPVPDKHEAIPLILDESTRSRWRCGTCPAPRQTATSAAHRDTTSSRTSALRPGNAKAKCSRSTLKTTSISCGASSTSGVR
jgi:hypothetical protein